MNTIVKTIRGEVRGSVADGVCAFKSVPYAAPPFGANRFRPPQPVEPWRGVRDALAYGPTPPQVSFPAPFDTLFPTIEGEDCLNLNIWTRELGSARQPVMVWIPGGAFESSVGSAYDGARFARDGVVCVTTNYRVGADGFLYLGDGIANLGLLDQIAALQWVQENIGAFGGDPDNVTVFGESAGAMSIGMLLAAPRADGLFRRAILQSGAAHPVMSAVTAGRVGQCLADKLGVAATRDALAAVPTDRLIAAQEELKADLAAHPDPRHWGMEVVISQMLWQAVIDGEVIPARPIDRISAGAGAQVDVLIGTTTDEWRLFVVVGGMIDQVTVETLAAVIAAYGLPLDAALATYRAAHPDAGPGDLLAAVQSDWYVRVPALRLADAYAKHRTATYMYEFAWRSPQFNGLLGACHGLEIPFVFDTLDDEATQLLTGPNPPQHLADTMHASWIAFATNGDPGWSRYDLPRRATMRFDATSEVVVDDPRAAERAVWQVVR